MDIPESIFNGIDLIIEIPQANKDEIIRQISIVQNDINYLVTNKKSFLLKEQIAHLYYLKGYIYYLHPNRSIDELISHKVEKFLDTAIKLDSNHSMAKLYLGHNYYDNKDYFLAKKIFNSISRNSIDQYFYIKVLEMSLCCSIKTQSQIVWLEDLESFIQEIEQCPIEDIHPHSLARAIKGFINSNSLPDTKIVRLMERLDNAGDFSNWFTELIHP